MIGRRGFFGALAACFAWMLPFKRSEAVAYWSEGRMTLPAPNGTTDQDGNSVFGYDSGVKAGVKNAVVMGVGSIAEKSNVVILGNEKTETLIFGEWELVPDEYDGLRFVNRRTGRKYRMTEINPPLTGNQAPGYPAFGEHALKCGGPECPAGSHSNEALGRDALR